MLLGEQHWKGREVGKIICDIRHKVWCCNYFCIWLYLLFAFFNQNCLPAELAKLILQSLFIYLLPVRVKDQDWFAWYLNCATSQDLQMQLGKTSELWRFVILSLVTNLSNFQNTLLYGLFKQSYGTPYLPYDIFFLYLWWFFVICGGYIIIRGDLFIIFGT